MLKLPFSSPFYNSPVYYLPETTSTMVEAFRLDSEEAPPGTVIVTDFQTAGKGRLPGREWEAARGENLLFTLILGNNYFSDRPTFVPLAAGLAVCTTLEELAGLSPEIRWPNDVLVNEKKISGILCSIKGKKLYIGIGLNLNQSEFNREFQCRATSVFFETNKHNNRDDFLKTLLGKLFLVFEMENPLSLIEKRLWLLNKTCFHTDGDGGSPVKGIFTGLGKNGELCFVPEKSASGVQFVSGSIRKVLCL